MAYPDREQARHIEQENDVTKLIDHLLATRITLLSPEKREKLKGTVTTINHFRNTTYGLGVIQEVDFTILDGVTFMWDGRHPAAIAYGRTPAEEDLLVTGGIFSSRSLRKNGIDPSEAYFFPALVSEIPGYPDQFKDLVAFRMTNFSPYSWRLTVGGRSPETRMTTPVFGRDCNQQIVKRLNTSVGINI